jgi:hypothetical protein
MRSYKGIKSATALMLTTAIAFASSAIAADLPQSGSVKIHSAFKVNNQAAEMGDKHFMGSFNAWAITYNDAGSGPLHMGSALCAGSFNDTNGSYDAGGWCAWGDANGDKFFTVFTGKGTDNVGQQGTHTITGGTGKFAGIQGKGSYQCKDVNPSQSLTACTQQFDYSLAQ